MNNHRRSMAPGPERASTRLGANKETPIKTPRFQFYLTSAHRVRDMYVLCASLIARAALRLPIPNGVEGQILYWAMGVLEEAER